MLHCQVIGFGLGLGASVAFPPMKRKKRRSWIERYVSASPEEQLRMDEARERRGFICVLFMVAILPCAFLLDRCQGR